MHIHGILVLDTDSTEPAHMNRKLNLQAGLHPYTLTVRTFGSAQKSVLLWQQGGNNEPVAVPATTLFH